jgi:hypothetical protein
MFGERVEKAGEPRRTRTFNQLIKSPSLPRSVSPTERETASLASVQCHRVPSVRGYERGYLFVSDALLGVIIGGAIAIGGAFVNGWWSAREQRKREHDARVHAWRGTAYIDVLKVHRQAARRVETIMPVLDSGAEPSTAPSPEELDAALAAVSAYGSEPVRGLVEELRGLNNRFHLKAQAYHEEKERGAGPGGEQLERYRAVEELRKEYRAVFKTLADRIASELQDAPK